MLEHVSEAKLSTTSSGAFQQGEPCSTHHTQIELPEQEPYQESAEKCLVEWNSPEDPQNPRNWSPIKRYSHIAIASATAFIANMTSTAFAPAAESLQNEFDITSSTISALTVSIYLLGLAFGPLVIAPLSEYYGRLPVYHSCLIVSISFLIGCSQATTTPMFLVFRLINGIGGSGPVTIGAGTIADVTAPQKRGKAMAIFALGPILGPVTGGVMSGFIAEYAGWRWIFRVLYIAISVILITALIMMRETYAPSILRRKAAKLRRKTKNPKFYSKYDDNGSALTALLRACLRPTKMLLFSPIVSLLSFFCAFVWGVLILLFTTFPAVYRGQYGWSQGLSGLSYVGMGVGMLLAVTVGGFISDKVVQKRSDAKHEEWKVEGRLLPMVWFAPVLPGGFFWYGWAAYYKTPWIVPILGTTMIGIGSLFVLMPIQLYLVDAFGPERGASASAVMSLLRSLAACFLPLAGPHLDTNLGLGWGNSLLGFIAIGFSLLPVLFYKYGGEMRRRWPVDF